VDAAACGVHEVAPVVPAEPVDPPCPAPPAATWIATFVSVTAPPETNTP
jgi:hypothetical protein